MNYTPEVEEIEPIKQIVERSDSPVTQRLRVAAYARVSTEQDEQQNSYEAQVQYYTEYIKANPLWEFIGVFSDAGITGTNTKNRDGFNQMISLALSGGIDLILTKSISRFARNTVDTLSTVRQLKEAGVEVIFEKENLRTFDPKCEVMLTIMSSLAQEESRSISENVRWGQQKSMKDGKVHIAYSAFLGYRKGPDGRPEIVEEEAKIVREIYDMFLSGMTVRHIAKSLTVRGIPTPKGRAIWPTSTVENILTNEKYKGEAILQKTYTVDYLSKKVRKNRGEMKQYIVRNSHEPIIDPETFERVQEMIALRKPYAARLRDDYPFSAKLICGDCGSFYGSKVWHNRGNTDRYTVWYCNHRYGKTDKCSTPILREHEIQAAFEAARKIIGDSDCSYSDQRWRETVESVTVYQDQRMVFHFKDGTEAEVHL